ncbi:hypothetical protein D9M72_498970 [compost metagenome]
MWGDTHRVAEKVLQMAGADADTPGKPRQRQGRLHGLLHQLDGGADARIEDAHVADRRHLQEVAAGTLLLVDEQAGHFERQRIAVRAADQF